MKQAFVFLTTVFLLAACGNNDQAAGKPQAKAGDSSHSNLPSPPPADAVDSTESLVALEKQHALVPSDPALALDLAYAYSEQKNAKALTLADSLLRAKMPEAEKAYYIKANYFFRINNTAAALKNYDAAIGANFHFLDAYFDKGKLLFEQKRYDEALKTFAIGQKVSPATADFYYWVAKTQEAMGQKADAKMNYERAYALDKTLTEAKAAAERLK